jgi:hypothetical protein
LSNTTRRGQKFDDCIAPFYTGFNKGLLLRYITQNTVNKVPLQIDNCIQIWSINCSYKSNRRSLCTCQCHANHQFTRRKTWMLYCRPFITIFRSVILFQNFKLLSKDITVKIKIYDGLNFRANDVKAVFSFSKCKICYF